MTFEQMLGYGYVVASDDFLGAIIVWNGKETFDVFTEDDYRSYRFVVCFSQNVKDASEAKKTALKWISAEYNSLEHKAA